LYFSFFQLDDFVPETDDEQPGEERGDSPTVTFRDQAYVDRVWATYGGALNATLSDG
jgi:hypothetical protein